MKKTTVRTTMTIAAIALLNVAMPTYASQEDVRNVIDILHQECAGQWNEDHTEVTITNKEHCYEVALQLKDSAEHSGYDDAVTAIDDFIEQHNL